MIHGDGLADLLRSLSARLAGRSSATPLPDAAEIDAGIRQTERSADLIARFVSAANAAGARATRVRSNALAETLHAVLAREAVRSIVIAPPLLEPCWPQFEARVTAGGVQVFRGHDEGTLFSVDASITGALAGIAETGSLLVATGPAVTRGESLFVPTHIALLPASAIVADLVDAAAVLAGCVQRSSNATFITGPSKTADIEGVLVTGVHGPGVLHIVVIDDR